MDRSLTIILPLKNAGHTLQSELTRLLDTAPDLTQRFEVLMIDWGSTDHSEEIAMDAIREFPQLHWLRMSRAGSAAEVIQAGMKRATGDIIIARQHETPLTPSAVRKLWQMEMASGGKPVTTPQGYMVMRRDSAAASNAISGAISSDQQRSFRVDHSRDVSGRRPPMFISQAVNAGR